MASTGKSAVGYGAGNAGKVNVRNLNPDPTKLGRYTLVWLGWAFFLSIGSLFFIAGYAHLDLHRITTALLWALACTVSGIAVGFLFGIPKVNQPKKNSTHSSPIGAFNPADASQDGNREDYSQRVNTSLEEISDWLTKIIVGLGLVQMRDIPGYLRSMATMLAGCLGDGCSEALAMALIVWFALLGFLVGYLSTRIYLATVFAIADYISRSGASLISKELQEQEKKVARGMEKVDEAARREADISPMIIEGLVLIGKKEKADPEEVSATIGKLKDILRQYPDHARAATILGRMYRWNRKDYAAAISVLTAAIDALRAKNLGGNKLGVLLYNRACYRILQKDASIDDVNGLVAVDLKEALKNSDEVRSAIASDEDLDGVREQSWFAQLLDTWKIFRPDPLAVPLVKKDDTNVVVFKNGEPKSVDIVAPEDKQLLEAATDGKTLKVTQKTEGGEEDTTVKVTVTGGKEGKDNEEAVVIVTIRKKSS